MADDNKYMSEERKYMYLTKCIKYIKNNSITVSVKVSTHN